MGLARYGLGDEAARLATALRDAVGFYSDRRLPELFAGIGREETAFPVEYATSNSPQAWAAGAILLAVTAMLGLRISIPERSLALRPSLPPGIAKLVVSGLEIAGAKVEVEARRRADGFVDASVRGAPSGFRVEPYWQTIG